MRNQLSYFNRDKAKIWMYLLIGIYSAFTLFVLFWVLISSLKTNKEFIQNIWAFPKNLVFENYNKAWNIVNMKRFFLNSIFIVLSSVLVLDLICAPAAYAIGRFTFKISKYINFLFIMGLGIPIPIILIPLYKIFIRLHLIDNMFGLIIAYVVVSIPFTVFLLVGFMRSLPSELEEAATIDGCSNFGAFWKVMFPLSTPGIIAASIFNFVNIWNEYLIALTFITKQSNRPLSLGLYSLQNAMLFTADWTGMFAGVMIVTIPTLILFILLSEKIMTAMTLGAVKG